MYLSCVAIWEIIRTNQKSVYAECWQGRNFLFDHFNVTKKIQNVIEMKVDWLIYSRDNFNKPNLKKKTPSDRISASIICTYVYESENAESIDKMRKCVNQYRWRWVQSFTIAFLPISKVEFMTRLDKITDICYLINCVHINSTCKQGTGNYFRW